ncbi:unnamed protein product, partial [Nesidiocoris tenuis]
MKCERMSMESKKNKKVKIGPVEVVKSAKIKKPCQYESVEFFERTIRPNHHLNYHEN